MLLSKMSDGQMQVWLSTNNLEIRVVRLKLLRTRQRRLSSERYSFTYMLREVEGG
jgi:hypothetical protein